MPELQGWEWVIFAVAAVAATSALARLMTHRHRQLETQFREEWQAERQKKAE